MIKFKTPEYESLIRALHRALRTFMACFLSSVAILLQSNSITDYKAVLSSVVISGIAAGLNGVSKLLRDDQDIDTKII